MTPKDLSEALREIGRAIPQRRLTDWRAKGLLPRLKQRGQGQGRGALFLLSELEILDRVVTVDDLLRLKARAQPALLSIWLCGYDVDIGQIRSVWLHRIISEENEIRRLDRQKGGIENFYAALATRTAKKEASRFNVNWSSLEELLFEFLGLLFDPKYSLEYCSYEELFLEVVSTLTKVPIDWLRRRKVGNLQFLADQIRSRLTTAARKNLVGSAAASEFASAHWQWRVLGELARMVLSPISPEMFERPGLNGAKQIAIGLVARGYCF